MAPTVPDPAQTILPARTLSFSVSCLVGWPWVDSVDWLSAASTMPSLQQIASASVKTGGRPS